jgi:hypothetical protein
MQVEIHGQIDLNEIEESAGVIFARQKETAQNGHFSDELYNNLPKLIKDGTDILKGNDREVFLVGSLAALSSVLPNIQAIYDGQAIESNLYLFLYGSYGSGKGALRYSRNIVSPVHGYLRTTEPQEIQGEPKPKKKLLFLPANSSKSGLIELLDANGKGLIFETESDSLTDILNQDYGRFSDILRMAYHHETISFYRRLDKEYYDIDFPRLSVLLSGTPGQLRKLIPSVENGLFSRFCYFGLESEPNFKNVFDTSNGDLNRHFYLIGERFLPLFVNLTRQTEPAIFELKSHQKAEFLAYFQNLKTALIETYGDTMAGSVNRFGVQFFRLAMIYTTLRILETGDVSQKMQCTDIDYQNAILTMDAFIWHALNIYDSMAVNNLEELPENKKAFYKALTTEFKTVQAVQLGQEYNISESTVKRFIDNRQLFEYVRHGIYKKKK